MENHEIVDICKKFCKNVERRSTSWFEVLLDLPENVVITSCFDGVENHCSIRAEGSNLVISLEGYFTESDVKSFEKIMKRDSEVTNFPVNNLKRLTFYI